VGNNQGKYIMNQNSTPQPAKTPAAPASGKSPNDTGSISVQGFIKIHDPVTKKVYVEKRA
jgi:hypothetical protein